MCSVSQTDVAGNTSGTTTYTFILDTIAPTAAIVVAPPTLQAGERYAGDDHVQRSGERFHDR